MKMRTPLARAIRLAIGGAVGFSAALTAPVGLAQQADENSAALGEVIITGSRIRQSPLEERLPVLTLGSEELRASGATSLADGVSA